MSKHHAIKVVKLTKTVQTQEGELTILKGVDMEVKPGQSVAIIGPSGSGKSTLLGLLAALDTPSTGEIWLDGSPLSGLDEEAKAALRKQKVSFVFQSFMLVDTLTALENVMLPAELAGIRDAKARALNMLERVGLSHRLHHLPKQLSGGEQQRVAIARAFICEPSVLFADEPTGNLDGGNAHRVADMLFALNQELGTTLVLVTHDNQLALRCERQFTMTEGELAETTKAASSAAHIDAHIDAHNEAHSDSHADEHMGQGSTPQADALKEAAC